VWVGIGLKSQESTDNNSGSRGSRGSPYLNSAGNNNSSDKSNAKSNRPKKQDKGNRVNLVNPVNTPDNEKGAETYSTPETGRSDSGANLPNSRSSVRNLNIFQDTLGMSVDQAIELWRRCGAPIIHLCQFAKCIDLAKYLSRPDESKEHLEAVRAWFEEHKDGLTMLVGAARVMGER